MAKQPRKPLTLKTSATGDNKQPPTASLSLKRSGKRIIRRDQLPAQSLATTKAPTSGKPAKNKKTKKVVTKHKVTPPSDLRMVVLDQQLHEAFAVWNGYQPLALGIEKSIFCFIATHRISASKRVVQKLLKRHTSTLSYRENIRQQAMRYELDGTPAGEISQSDKDHAQRQADVAHST